MLQRFIQDEALFQEVKEYIQSFFANYCLDRIRENKETTGLHHAMISVENAFKSMKSEFGPKKAPTKTDHTA